MRYSHSCWETPAHSSTIIKKKKIYFYCESFTGRKNEPELTLCSSKVSFPRWVLVKDTNPLGSHWDAHSLGGLQQTQRLCTSYNLLDNNWIITMLQISTTFWKAKRLLNNSMETQQINSLLTALASLMGAINSQWDWMLSSLDQNLHPRPLYPHGRLKVSF